MKDLSTPRRRSGSHREVTLEIVPGAAYLKKQQQTSLPVASQAPTQERHSTLSQPTWQDCISSFLVPDQKSRGFFLFFFCLFNTRSRTHLFWKLQRSLWPANSLSKGTWVHPALFSPLSNSYHCYHTVVITKRTKTVTHAQTADDWQGVGRQSALRWTCEGQCGDFRRSLTHCHRPDLWCLS